MAISNGKVASSLYYNGPLIILYKYVLLLFLLLLFVKNIQQVVV